MNKIDGDAATIHPELAKALIMAIIPLQDYLLTESARNNITTLWTFTIGELKTQLSNLAEYMNGIMY